MSGKFMKIYKHVIPTLTLIMIASQLMGCAVTTPKETQEILQVAQEVEIEIAVPISVELGEEQTEFDWIRLDQLDTYKDFRKTLDDIMMITRFGDNSKNGICYINLEGQQEGNNTLYNAMMNRKFITNFLENDTANLKTSVAINSLYVDLDENDSMLAAINAYWNLLPDATPNYFNPDQTLNRLEAMSLIARASNQVTDKIGDEDFTNAVGQSDFTDYASLVADDSYLSIGTKSLNPTTANGTITRGEYIYMLINNVFGSDRMSKADIQKIQFNDCKNGGDIASQQNYRNETKVNEYYESDELKYAIKNADKGCPERMYRALATAQELNIIGDETRWDEGLTKAEAIQLYIDTLQAYTKENGYPVDAVSGLSQEDPFSDMELPDEELLDTAGLDNPNGMTDDEINAEVIDKLDNVETSDFEIISINDTKMYCTSNSANIRKGPNTSYDKVGTLSFAQEIMVNGKVETGDSTWFVVKTDDNSIQMVSSSLLSETQPQLQTPKTSSENINTSNISENIDNVQNNSQPSNEGLIVDGGGEALIDEGVPIFDWGSGSGRGGLH